MKREQHPVDHLFREALQGDQIRPSEQSRDQFLEEASSILTAKKRIRFRWFFAGFVSLILLGIAFFAMVPFTTTKEVSNNRQINPLISHNNPPTVDAKNNHTTTQSQTNHETITQTKDAFISTNKKVRIRKEKFKEEPIIEEQIKEKQIKEAQIKEEPIQNLKQTSPSLSPEIRPIAALVIWETGDKKGIQTIPKELINDTASLQEEEPSIADTLKPLNDTSDFIDTHKKSVRKWTWGFAASYSPEWMFNTLEGTKYVNNFALEASARNKGYYIRLGLGLSFNEGANELLVEYNDYLGKYQHLDSITFAWDERHYYLLPTYYSHERNVWDSLIKTDYPRITRRYTYIQLPVVFGYDFLRKKHISLGIRAGQILSLLIATKQLIPDYDPSLNRVIQVNTITLDRIESNWQVLAGINFTYYINREISLELEPMARYYFTSVYEKSDLSKKVWSLGFRVAININP